MDWVSQLHVIEFIINSTMSEATQLSPFEVTRGYRPRRGGVLDDLEERGMCPRPRDIEKFVRTRLREARERMLQHDKGSEYEAYRPGDRIYVSKTRTAAGKTVRFDEQRLGPYVVLKKINAKTYALELLRGSRARNVFHVDRLTRCVNDNLPVVQTDVDDDGNEYLVCEVEEIVGAGVTGRRNVVTSVHLKWRGYGDEFNTWQDLDEVLDDMEAHDNTSIRIMLQDFIRDNEARLTGNHEKRLFPDGR